MGRTVAFIFRIAVELVVGETLDSCALVYRIKLVCSKTKRRKPAGKENRVKMYLALCYSFGQTSCAKA